MGVSISVILLILAFICFALAAVGVSSARVNLTALGLALGTLAMLIR